MSSSVINPKPQPQTLNPSFMQAALKLGQYGEAPLVHSVGGSRVPNQGIASLSNPRIIHPPVVVSISIIPVYIYIYHLIALIAY